MNKKLIISILGLVVILCSLGIYKVLADQNKEVYMDDKKILIAYFSHSDNTKAVAEKIQDITGGDLFEIKPQKPYPREYNAVVEIGKQEKENNVFPELADNGNVENYDIVFIGTPVWWYTMAGPVKTFIANNNFDGKIIAPFCTHGGGGASATYTDMQKLAPNATVTEGFTSYEHSAKTEDVKKWISGLKF